MSNGGLWVHDPYRRCLAGGRAGTYTADSWWGYATQRTWSYISVLTITAATAASIKYFQTDSKSDDGRYKR